jgi:hypothetical protein
MRYKVEYITQTGTHSDNEIIGVYDSPTEAAVAKQRYIADRVGILNEIENDPDFDIEEYRETLFDYTNNVLIEEFENMY